MNSMEVKNKFREKLDQARDLIVAMKFGENITHSENREYVAGIEAELSRYKKLSELQDIEIRAKERNELNTNQLLLDFIHEYADHWKNKTIKHETLQSCPTIKRAMNHLEIIGEL
jgi:hypothetical protein